MATSKQYSDTVPLAVPMINVMQQLQEHRKLNETKETEMINALPFEMANMARLAVFVRSNARNSEEMVEMMTTAIQADLSLRSLFYEQGRECLRFMDAIAPMETTKE